MACEVVVAVHTSEASALLVIWEPELYNVIRPHLGIAVLFGSTYYRGMAERMRCFL